MCLTDMCVINMCVTDMCGTDIEVSKYRFSKLKLEKSTSSLRTILPLPVSISIFYQKPTHHTLLPLSYAELSNIPKSEIFNKFPHMSLLYVSNNNNNNN